MDENISGRARTYQPSKNYDTNQWNMLEASCWNQVVLFTGYILTHILCLLLFHTFSCKSAYRIYMIINIISDTQMLDSYMEVPGLFLKKASEAILKNIRKWNTWRNLLKPFNMTTTIWNKTIIFIDLSDIRNFYELNHYPCLRKLT